MAKESTNDDLKIEFRSSGFYEIRVLDKIPFSAADKLQDMEIMHHSDEDGTVSILKGMLHDQAALSGLLNNLYDMHCTVLSVKRISKKSIKK